MKIYISADMEGISGVVSLAHVEPGSGEYERFRRLMTREVNAVVEAAFEFGASEVVVNDSHNNMDNILVEELHPRTSLISGSPKPLSMMQGIDGSFDAVFFIGYHARAGSSEAIMDHTYTGRVMCAKINGKSMSEAGLNGRLAGYYGVPVVLVTGDQNAVKCAREELDDPVGVVVKEAVTRYSARVYPFDVVKERIREGVRQALEDVSRFRPTVEEGIVELEVTFNQSILADMALLIPGMTKKDARTVVYTAADYLEAYKAFRAALAINSGIR
ncbi:M55 family metallopeptidase [Thermosediminibacter litoriperuensis]|uniref:D-aminopeptidase DppA Metallo peptidase MEROPS family M55 n=1 Tax=Thermosediminibacter litoriperuensis TaxID=291989 RepID=A0A5S5ANV8_9FIRM|nr:M55 family metallopeptidase [Thermosediminibacter litoriperuensis]TYP53309.1 D-aminopeptidase DppA Metallo peptidase MEROPS family M55 [Thermosediminibacter litoriperuensis]